MQADSWARVQGWWAGLFGCGKAQLWQGLSVTEHVGLTGYEGIFVAHRSTGCHVSLPSWVDARTRESLSQQGISRITDPAFWRDLPETAALSVIGPSVHGYTDGASWSAPATSPAGTVVEASGDQLEGLRSAMDPAEWDEGGFADGASRFFVLRVAGEVVAAANLTEFLDGPADIGVVVHPAFRGRGLGLAVAAAATSYALEEVGVARWRARVTNAPSRAMAAALGFESYCHQMAIRP
jgi:GNAT superfamily N-acetyltransferase